MDPNGNGILFLTNKLLLAAFITRHDQSLNFFMHFNSKAVLPSGM